MPERMIRLAELAGDVDNPAHRSSPDPELVESIRAVGVRVPLIVEPAGRGFVIVDGHRRAAAARAAGRVAVPCVLRPRTDQAVHVLDRLLTNGYRLPLEPIEQAHALADLRRREGLSIAELATRTGISQATIRDRLALLTLDHGTQAMVTDGRLTLAGAAAATRQVRTERPPPGRPAEIRRPTSAPAPTWFGPRHPLAGVAGAICRAAPAKHAARLPGGVACGQHWEQAITEAAVAATTRRTA